MKLIINHLTQPTGNSCGPTCIMMAYQYVSDKPQYDIMDICNLCNTDWIVGTPPDRLEKGLNALNLSFIHHLESKNPYNLLKNVLDSGNIPIVRTITHNIPHWILVVGYDENGYLINDPAQGEITYTEKELDKVWSLRDYEFYEIKHLQIKQGITDDELANIIYWAYPSFKHIVSLKYFNEIILEEANLEKSLLLSGKNGEILGAYVIGDTQINHPEYNHMTGVEGVMLAVDDSIKGTGWGTILKDYPKKFGVDYIWGQQAEGLDNLKYWLKRRVLVEKYNDVYITAEIYNNKQPDNQAHFLRLIGLIV